MKQQLKAALAATLCLCLLAGCAGSAAPASSTASVPAAPSSPASIAPPEPTVASSLPEIVAGEGEDFPLGEEHFLQFLEQSQICVILSYEIENTAVLAQDKNYQAIRSVIYEYQHAMELAQGVMPQTNDEGNPYYPTAQVQQLAAEMFGLELDFSHLEDRLREYFPSPEGMLCVPWEIDYNHYTAQPDQDTLHYSKGLITIEVDLFQPGLEDPVNRLLYCFAFMADQPGCPYMLQHISTA